MLDTHGIIGLTRLTQARYIDAACTLLYHNLARSVGLCESSQPHSAIERAFCVSSEGDMTKEIYLSNGGVVLVDDDDYDQLSQRKWRRSNNGYAYREVSIKGKRVSIYLHKEIMPTDRGWQVDHIDRDRMNCRKSNLRYCTPSQNGYNAPKRNSPTSSIYKGVSWNGKKWEVLIQANGQRIYVGRFDDEIEAARARDVASIKYHGEFAVLNFPDEIS